MGKASNGDRQNLRGDVRRGYVDLATRCSRPSVIVPYGTLSEGVGRRIKWIPRDGSRRKDEGGPEPPRGTSCRPHRMREPPSNKGSDPLCYLGVCCRDLLARPLVWSSDAAQIPQLHGGRNPDTRARHWRQHSNFFRSLCGLTQTDTF